VKDGFTYDSPSELNGLVGVVEAVAYAMRIYGIFIAQHGTAKDISTHAMLQNIVLDQNVLNKYDADIVMRKLPVYGDQLQEAFSIVKDIVELSGGSMWPANCKPGSRMTMNSKLTTIIDHFPATAAAGDTCTATDTGDCESGTTTTIDVSKTLSNGVVMPIVGLGTWKLTGGDCEDIASLAMKLGYRHFDTAEAYGNEWDIGWAIEKAMTANTVRREELFIASKISNPSHAGAAGVRALVLQQLKWLRIEYLDLYMLHSPLSDGVQEETWSEMEKMYDEGLIKSLGVSNFGIHDLSKLLHSARVKPMVLQNKFDVYHQGTQFDNQGLNVLKFCKDNNIALVSYSPFSAYPFTMVPLADPIVEYVASRHNLSPAETLMLWHLQLGLAVVPRSSRGPGLRENLMHRLTTGGGDGDGGGETKRVIQVIIRVYYY
jgi:diketogulonate reductase-like aldo/keto reductase